MAKRSSKEIQPKASREILAVAYLVVSAGLFVLYSFVRPSPSLFELVVFIVVLAFAISGFSLITRSTFKIKDNKIALASGPAAAIIGSLVVLIPFAKDIAGNTKKLDGTCEIHGIWKCVNCQFNKTAEVRKISEGGAIREIEFTQAGSTWRGRYLFERNIILLKDIQQKGQTVIGFVAPDCKRVDWNYLWIWQRD